MRKKFVLTCLIALLIGISGGVMGLVSAETTAVTDSYLPIISHNPCPGLNTNEDIASQYHHENMQNQIVWECKSTGKNVVVAVVDTGVDPDHFDLVPNLLPGATFVGAETKYDDDVGHGTHVAGIIAAAPNNGGVIGTAPEAKILPVRSLGQRGGSTREVSEGIFYAVDSGADIINLSLGSRHQSDRIKAAIDHAHEQGVLVIAAAGNCGDPVNWDRQGCKWHNVASYPAGYSTVMAIASTDDNDENSHSVFSTQNGYVDAAAPGRNVLSTWKSGKHAAISGTSMATPNVAAVAALIMSRYPDLTAQQVRNALTETAIDLGSPGHDTFYGHGFVDAYEAIIALDRGLVPSLSVPAQRITDVEPVNLDELTPDEYVAGDIVMALADGVAIESLLQSAASRGAVEMKVVPTDETRNFYQVTVSPGSELETIRLLRETKGVLYAEPNFIVETY